MQTDVDLATMEGANESGRAAVNALLEASGSKAEPAAMYKLYDPPEFEAAKAADRELYKQGQPNAARQALASSGGTCASGSYCAPCGRSVER